MSRSCRCLRVLPNEHASVHEGKRRYRCRQMSQYRRAHEPNTRLWCTPHWLTHLGLLRCMGMPVARPEELTVA